MTTSTCSRILITSVWLLCCGRPSGQEVASTPDLPSGRHVVFSELSLTPSLGLTQSWLELYNRSTERTDLSDVRIVFNGKSLVTFPTGFSVPPKGLLLLRFCQKDSPKWQNSTRRGNVIAVTLRGTSQRESGEHAPTAGYCALLQGGGRAEPRLLDYVRWGRKPLPDDEAYFQRASQIGAWHPYRSAPVYIGLAPEPGDPPPPRAGPTVLSRLAFSLASDQTPPWVALPLARSTPGAGNTSLPAPVITTPLDGFIRHRKDGLGVAFRTDVLPKGEKSEYRLQLAIDPHFENVISDVSLQQTYHTFKADLLPQGPCFLRAKWRSNALATPWSQTVCVILK